MEDISPLGHDRYITGLMRANRIIGVLITNAAIRLVQVSYLVYHFPFYEAGKSHRVPQFYELALSVPQKFGVLAHRRPFVRTRTESVALGIDHPDLFGLARDIDHLHEPPLRDHAIIIKQAYERSF